MVLQDHGDVKRHWVDKCCNKFKKLTGIPGDPKRDMILRCQRIQEWLLKKSAFCIMGADLEGDEGRELSGDSSSISGSIADDGEANGNLLGYGYGVVVGDGGLLAVEHDVAEELAGGIGGHSRNTTPTNLVDVDSDGGVRIMAPDELPIAVVPPLQSATQQLAEGAAFNAPLFTTQ
jgi:hypothetical protein